jgi:hypothetical protein
MSEESKPFPIRRIESEEKEVPEDQKKDEQEGKDMEKIPLNPQLAKPFVSGQESEIAKYRVAEGLTVRLISTGPLTAKAVEKLIKHLKIDWEDIKLSDIDNESTNN